MRLLSTAVGGLALLGAAWSWGPPIVGASVLRQPPTGSAPAIPGFGFGNAVGTNGTQVVDLTVGPKETAYIKAQEKLVVRIPGNATSGYWWVLNQEGCGWKSQHVVDLVGHHYGPEEGDSSTSTAATGVAAAPPGLRADSTQEEKLGEEGIFYFDFVGTASGEVTLCFDYKQPWPMGEIKGEAILTVYVTPPEIVLEMGDHKEVTMYVHEIFGVKLPGDPKTGFWWALKKESCGWSQQYNVKLMDETYVPESSDAAENVSGGYFYFTFLTLYEGDIDLCYKYKQNNKGGRYVGEAGLKVHIVGKKDYYDKKDEYDKKDYYDKKNGVVVSADIGPAEVRCRLCCDLFLDPNDFLCRDCEMCVERS